MSSERDAGEIGIAACGAYVPSGRLAMATLSGRKPEEGGPERSVAGFDEDSVTMAVAAAVDCLAGIDRAHVDAVYFASTTAPYAEKQSAAIVAKALDLRRDVRTADFGHSLRAGLTALSCAADAVRAGSVANVLVVAADCRLAPPRSAMESSLGDGAAAFWVTADGVFAAFGAHHAVSDEMLDLWRSDGERYVQTWEERFVIEHGYLRGVGETARGLFERTGTAPNDYARLVMYGPDARSHASAVRALGFDRAQVVDPLFGRVGNCGVAHTALLLAHALQEAQNGQRLLAIAYGDGAEALELTVRESRQDACGRRGVDGCLLRRRPLRSYDAYLAARNLSPGPYDRRAGAGIAATVHYRDRDADISFRAARCRGCGTLHFPAQRVCYGCQARDDFDPVRLSDRTGRVMSYTLDSFFPTPEPPLVAAMIEVDGGARLLMQMCDVSPQELRCELPVEFVFRKIHEAGGKPNYFWKCTPIRETEAIAAGGAQGEPR